MFSLLTRGYVEAKHLKSVSSLNAPRSLTWLLATYTCPLYPAAGTHFNEENIYWMFFSILNELLECSDFLTEVCSRLLEQHLAYIYRLSAHLVNSSLTLVSQLLFLVLKILYGKKIKKLKCQFPWILPLLSKFFKFSSHLRHMH